MRAKTVKSRFIKRLLKKTRLYEDYLPVASIFEEPKLICKFGLWRRDSCLPVWRNGPVIRFYKDYFDTVQDPNKYWKLTWTADYKKKHPIKTFFFRRPTINLPIWMSFRKFSHPMIWKTKWDDYRFEFPPQYTIVLFGISLSFWLTAPEVPGSELRGMFEDTYWETILYYKDPCNMSGRGVYDDHLPQFKNDWMMCSQLAGIHSIYKPTDEKVSYWAMQPEFLKMPYKEQWVEFVDNNDPYDGFPASYEPPKKTKKKTNKSYKK